MKANELGDWIRDEERGVSPVIGVILMVAITVILAAVIAAFVLDLGQSQSANPAAGFDVEWTDSSDWSVELNNIDRLDSWEVQCSNTQIDEHSSAEVGQTIDQSSDSGPDCSSESDLQIIGEYEGESSVLS